MGAKLLFVGDIHLGRRPGRLPADLSELGLDVGQLSPTSAWRETVKLARDERADAVVLAGDVVERMEDRFEAYAHLARGVRALVEDGIPVYGVAGNHDVLALPRLADQIPEFRLLGRDGCWQSAELTARDGTRVRLLGWSFPQAEVREDPLASLRETPSTDVATLGVLHCDLDGGASRYAPVPRRSLEAAPGDAWLLGHVHRPSDLAVAGARPIGYLGSLVGLDPGEPGFHGPWWAHVEGPGRVQMEPVPLAPLRWEREDVALAEVDAEFAQLAEGAPLSAAGDAAELRDRLADPLFGALRRALGRIHDRLGPGLRYARLVGCRLVLVGRSRHHRLLAELAEDVSLRPREEWSGVHYFVESVQDEAAPAVDLVRLASGSDPAALYARRVLALEGDGEEARSLVRAAAPRLRQAVGGRSWAGAGPEELDEEAVRRLLLRAATQGLETLLGQRPGGENAEVAG